MRRHWEGYKSGVWMLGRTEWDLEATNRRLGQVERLDLDIIGNFGKGSCVWISSAYRRKQVIPNHSGLGAVRDSEWPHVLRI
ncbi:hypothetical protein F383_01235 [Gossypium arboreum]|uniref:Uncharacterized protein n=1 Tax=Gossypium arboreum TaxID=29729 RepID=A0A0B0NZZ5_GOSAR|nr:hypothetical protein F383_01235 [Gossypium arboreum]